MSGMQSNLEKFLEWILLNKKRPKLFNVSPEMKLLDREILLNHSVKWHFRRGFQKRYRSKGEKTWAKKKNVDGFPWISSSSRHWPRVLYLSNCIEVYQSIIITL